MAEQIFINNSLPLKERYEDLIPQLKALVSGEDDMVANAANICAALKETFGWLWIGFYFVKNTEAARQLVLGPFQGPVACTRIDFNKGVCGTAWANRETLIVDNVDLFPGHIACNSLSRSEIVVPVIQHNSVIAVLDIDSHKLSAFTETDAHYLEKIVNLLTDGLR
ncbi:MAG: GAF domain-containing protein [Bacteroidetes bacterium]|jgi:GAF domain-containing protein|nr:GAF domain-containing protein [Bacteroidota bacterium]